MNRKLRAVKSEYNNTFLKRKIKVEPRRARTPLRFSRRLRQLPPEDVNYFKSVRDRLKKEKFDAKHVISKESSTHVSHSNQTPKFRNLQFPQKAPNSKELISILSAPKMCNKKHCNARKVMAVPTRVRGSSCKPKMLVKDKNIHMQPHYNVIKNIKKEKSDADQILEKRKQFVLEVLNQGDMKDIEKLHSVGSKTAERIILYRQIKGTINKISELAKMPKFPKQKFNNFIAQNFLKSD